jgi:vitamin K-dependent gamma-carboxylase
MSKHGENAVSLERPLRHNDKVIEMKNWINAFSQSMLTPIDGRVLGIFRVVFGLLMLYESYYYFDAQLIDNGFLKPYTLFKYEGFEFVDRLPRNIMFGLLSIMTLAALGITIGLFFRLSAIVFAVIHFYFLLLEKAYYNNHIYLMVLLAVLFACTQADHFYSVKPKAQRQSQIPFWQQFIFQLQLVIVYFYAAFVKLKPDWLVLKQPMTSLVNGFPAEKTLAWLVKSPGMIEVLTYGGLLLDLSAPLLLFFKPFRKYIIIPFILFHFLNAMIFDDIGVFPYLMAASMIVFFLPEQVFGLKALVTKNSRAADGYFVWNHAVKIGLICYFSFQLLFPLRGYFLPNALDYTTIGNRFAWRVKADTREKVELAFFATHPSTKQKLPVDMQVFLNPVQIQHLMQDPRSVLQFAKALEKEGLKQGVAGMIVQANIKIRYNGRPAIDFIDTEIDLTKATYKLTEPILWLNEPLD